MKTIIKRIWKNLRRAGLARACRYWMEKRAANAGRIEAIRAAAEANIACLNLTIEMQMLRAPVDVIEQNVRKEVEARVEQEQAKVKRDLRDALLNMCAMSDEQLYEVINLDVYGEGECWEVANRICQWGGCYIGNGNLFKTKRQALESAYIRTLFGEKLETSGLCSDCYNEYMESVI